ncbi:hypothetical protein [Rathayibacter sp. VKM Ac-2927]|uniref:hypothetical protein n=1 Tax=Rathayibacter sp. VKM Ac-2927 TaxID=2929478 RepID=UPI001FB1C546|nr:hypothetical protein [Rathayibacter sp. VKM Ac-2927]MCJ1688452.1 hypothetical protein [Rathayibacter sp. VKM Ac-2927]
MKPNVSRRSVVTAAWTTPVIVAAISAPAASASATLKQLSVRSAGPELYSQGTRISFYIFWVTNLGDATIPAGTLTVSLKEGPDFWFSGFSGLAGTWDYGPLTDDTLSFVYYLDVPPGTAGNEDDETYPLLMYLESSLPEDTQPPASATFVVTAPGYEPSVLTLLVPY